MTQNEIILDFIEYRKNIRQKRTDLPDLEVAKAQYFAAMEAFQTADNALKDLRKRTEERARIEHEKAKSDREMSLRQAKELERTFARLTQKEGWSRKEGEKIQDQISYFRRRADYANERVTAPYEETRKEADEIRAAALRFRETKAALERTMRDFEDAIGNEVDRLFEMWPNCLW